MSGGARHAVGRSDAGPGRHLVTARGSRGQPQPSEERLATDQRGLQRRATASLAPPQPPRPAAMLVAAAPLLLAIVFGAGVAWSAPRGITAEYVLLPGHGRYKISANYKTWEAAKSVCESEEAHLAVMDTEEEMDAVINMLVRCGIEYTRFDFWTGYFRREETGQWTTVIGWPVGGTGTGYTGWMSGYPNGVRDAACSRLLLTINARGLINGDCTNVGPFICEKNP